jgi:hypothetical protein
MESSGLLWDGKKLMVDNFLVHHNNQYIKLDGTLSDNNEDEFWIDLNKVNLDYIFELLPQNEESVRLGGNITVRRNLSTCLKNPKEMPL